MCKIYPPPFNKFAIFVLYGLLSIAATTLAQCGLSSKYGLKTMGYIDLFKDPPKNIDTFNWELYNQINIIVYASDASTPYNSIRQDPVSLEQINNLATDIKVKSKDTSVFLSIRNYEPGAWPGPENDELYGNIVKETLDTLKNLDGVDIEYPGMRGIYCTEIWKNKDQRAKSDVRFVEFLAELKGKMKEKPLMLTVGMDAAVGLIDHITYLNIETHHYSIYANLKQPPNNPDKVKSHPNAPLNIFEGAYNDWTKAGKINFDKIFMGVDFGNTFQVVSSQNIALSPTVETDSLDKPDNLQDLVINELKPINDLCLAVDDRLNLYSFPWRDLSTYVLDQNTCNSTTKPEWDYKFDDQSSTPWLYKTVSAGNGNPADSNFYYISFEDFKSLSKKLDFAVDKGVGISISDVSYDDDNGSLLSFVHDRETTEKSPNSGSGKSNVPNNPSNTDGSAKNPENTQPDQEDPGNGGKKGGVIAGAVIGSLFGSIIILGAGFLWYRNRDRPKSSSFKSLLNFKAIPSSIRNHSNSRDTEMTSDPSPNHRYAVPSTTAVIPIASGYVTALFDFTGKEENDLSFKKGDKIEVLERGDGPNDWWVGRVNGAVGEFPGNYVKET